MRRTSVLIISLYASLWGAVIPAYADIINPLPIFVSFPETAPLGCDPAHLINCPAVPITFLNSTVPGSAVSTTLSAAGPPQPGGGDTGFDLVTADGAGGGCDGITSLAAGSSCTMNLYVAIGDGDPLDNIRPQVDSGVWNILVTLPWTRLPSGPGGTAFTTVTVTVLDDTPEPESNVLVLTGMVLIALMYAKRTKRPRGQPVA